MNAHVDAGMMIERADGSMISYDKLSPEKQIEHDVVVRLCEKATGHSEALTKFKHTALAEMIAARVMMLEDHGVRKGGTEGNLTLRSACGRLMVKMTVSKHISFGPELEAAKELIGEFMEAELAKGGSDKIRDIVEKVFKLNAKGRIDTGGILGLREHRFDDPLWERAMLAIEEAICRDSATTYVNFYNVDPNSKPNEEREQRILLDLAKV